jgi:hypothetical protein
MEGWYVGSALVGWWAMSIATMPVWIGTTVVGKFIPLFLDN